MFHPQLIELCPDFDEFSPSSVEIGPDLFDSGPNWPKSAQLWSTPVPISSIWSNAAQIQPSSGRLRANFGRVLSCSPANWPIFGKLEPNSGPELNQTQPTDRAMWSVCLGGEFDRIGPEVAKFDHFSGDFERSWPCIRQMLAKWGRS